ncbi:MAG: endonuclease MutS2, partial [Oscillospiraceae bacterium]|nr:endonuclease MutS2 [Oscillospiraceae bacterium]
MTLFEKSLQTLEFPAVLQMLAQQAVSETAKERALALAPAESIYECRRLMAETTAAKKMMETRTAPSFSGVKDVRSAVSRADMGGVLNTRELLDIAGVLRAARTVSAYADGSERTEIDYMFSALHANKYLEEKITNSIAGDDEIADAASTELASIRRQMRITSSRIREALQKIISSSTYAKA